MRGVIWRGMRLRGVIWSAERWRGGVGRSCVDPKMIRFDVSRDGRTLGGEILREDEILRDTLYN